VHRSLLPIAIAWGLLWTQTTAASPFEWDAVARRVESPLAIASAELGVDPLPRPDSEANSNATSDAAWEVMGATIAASMMPIALGDAHAGEQWIVRPSAVFVPRSGATTYLDQLVQPHAEDPSQDPSLSESGHLQPLPAFETRARPIQAPPALARATIRYHGELVSMLPLTAGFLGLALCGGRPKPNLGA
jgi:hypothetical protein